MEPTREGGGALVDLLDRILVRGIVLDADIIISLAGVPLVALNLRAALAGAETMLRRGALGRGEAPRGAPEPEPRGWSPAGPALR